MQRFPANTGSIPTATVNGYKVAPFKDPKSDYYGGFANTTNKYPVTQTLILDGQKQTFKWPSSEHAYHAQKLIHLKNKYQWDSQAQQTLTNTLRKLERTKAQPGDEFLPRNDWDPLIQQLISNHRPKFGNNKQKFDSLCDANYHPKAPQNGLIPNTNEPYTSEFMRTVLRLKLDQHPNLKNLAMQMAREGIIPIEYSRHDSNWASGKDGSGSNRLGILLLEEGNRLLIQNGETPALLNPKAAYQQMQRLNQSALGHDSLIQGAQKLFHTSSYGSNYYQVPQQPNSSYAAINSTIPAQQPTKPNIDLVVYPSKKYSYTVVKRATNSKLELHIYPKGSGREPTAMYQDNSGRWRKCTNMNRANVQRLMRDYDLWLQQPQQTLPSSLPARPPHQSQVQGLQRSGYSTNYSHNPPSTNSRYNPYPHFTAQTTAPQTRAFNPSQTALFLLQTASLDGAKAINSAVIGPDRNVPSKWVLKLYFTSAQEAQKFAKGAETLTTNNPRVPLNGNEVVIGQNRCKDLCKKLYIDINYLHQHLPKEQTPSSTYHHSKRFGGPA